MNTQYVAVRYYFIDAVPYVVAANIPQFDFYILKCVKQIFFDKKHFYIFRKSHVEWSDDSESYYIRKN